MNSRVYMPVGALVGAVLLAGCGSSSVHQQAMSYNGAGSSPMMSDGGGMMGTSATVTPPSAGDALVIRHQLQGCHSWSYDGGVAKAAQTLRLHSGAILRVVDDDVMPHRLVQLGGPAAALTHAAMTHMQSGAKIRFPVAGTYRFRTIAGEDYTPGIKTLGADNVLRLVVVVT